MADQRTALFGELDGSLIAQGLDRFGVHGSLSRFGPGESGRAGDGAALCKFGRRRGWGVPGEGPSAMPRRGGENPRERQRAPGIPTRRLEVVYRAHESLSRAIKRMTNVGGRIA